MTFYVLTQYVLYMKILNVNSQGIWEENDLIEHSKKFVSRPIFAQNDGMNEIKNVFAKNECDDIGNKKNRPRQKYNTDHIGERFGKLSITKQYYIPNKRQSELKVDYLCDCGNITLNKSYQKVKNQKMCDKCRRTNIHKIKPNSSFNTLFFDYRRNADVRGIEFELSKETFSELTKGRCFYCGELPNAVRRPNAPGGSYVYNGIDRKDNSKGYTIDNCVSCCKICNFSKHKLNSDDFLHHITKIYNYQFVENRR